MFAQDALLQIFSYLNVAQIPIVSRICKYWYHVTREQALWRLYWQHDLLKTTTSLHPAFAASKYKSKVENLESYKFGKRQDKMLQFLKRGDFLKYTKMLHFCAGKTQLRMQRNCLLHTKKLQVEQWLAYFQLFEKMTQRFGNMFTQHLVQRMRAKQGLHTMLHTFAQQEAKHEEQHQLVLLVLKKLTSAPICLSLFAPDDLEYTPMNYLIQNFSYDIVNAALMILKQQCDNGLKVTKEQLCMLPLRYAFHFGASEQVAQLLVTTGMAHAGTLFGSLLCCKMNTLKYKAKRRKFYSFHPLQDFSKLLLKSYSLELLQQVTSQCEINWFEEGALLHSPFTSLVNNINDLSLRKIEYLISLLEIDTNKKQIICMPLNHSCLCALFAHVQDMEMGSKAMKIIELITRMLQMGSNVNDSNTTFCCSMVVRHFQKMCTSIEIWHLLTNLLVKYGANLAVLHEGMSLIDTCAKQVPPEHAKWMIQWLLNRGKTCYTNEIVQSIPHVVQLVRYYPSLEKKKFLNSKE